MNNQQAINLLKNLEQSLDDYCELNDEGKTAFRMGITALEVFGNSEQLPSVQPERKTDDDAISKQAALDILDEFADKCIEVVGGSYERARKEMCDLPAAQPERKTGRMSNKDWIDFLCEQFDISRTSARDMLHGMMKCKKEDNFKRVFNPMQGEGEG